MTRVDAFEVSDNWWRLVVTKDAAVRPLTFFGETLTAAYFRWLAWERAQ